MRLSSLSRLQPSGQILRSTRPSLRSNGCFNHQQSVQRVARRSYADAAPAPNPKKFRFLRWTWRLTLLSGAGLTGMLAYSIYDQRNPIEQVQPDPSKKTLVVLGVFLSPPCLVVCREIVFG